MQNTPQKLYHYTNVEALALILKNRNIKFNPLNRMDDTQEQKTSDRQNLGKICYVSSWSDSSKESIPMWRMYCSKESGVRISLPLDPFQRYCDYKYAQTHGIPNLKFKNPDSPHKTTIISFKEMLDKGFLLADIHGDNLIKQITYDNNKLYPNLVTKKEDSTFINTSDLGAYKSEYWSFQDEWRYRLFPLPISPKFLGTKTFFSLLMQKFETDNLALHFDSLFLKIRDECFEQMEVLMSPNISDGNKIILDALIKQYNPKVKLQPSELTDLIQ